MLMLADVILKLRSCHGSTFCNGVHWCSLSLSVMSLVGVEL